MTLPPYPITVNPSPLHGLGVFATRNITQGETIEICPVLIINIVTTCLKNYAFAWNDKEGTKAIPLGYGSLYNHSDRPNIYWLLDRENERVIFKAARDIQKDEELLSYYADGWFQMRNMEVLDKETLEKRARRRRLVLMIKRSLLMVAGVMVMKFIADHA